MDPSTTAVSDQLQTIPQTPTTIPVSLPFLNEALKPFLHSCISIELVLGFFQHITHRVYLYTETSTESLRSSSYQAYMYEPWQERLSNYRSGYLLQYHELELLKVAQILTRIDPVRVWEELEAHMHLHRLGGGPLDGYENKGKSYLPLTRDLKWLSECALAGLVDTDMLLSTRRVATANLMLVASCQPTYGLIENDTTACSRLDIFGPDGLLFPVLKSFTCDPEDQSGVEKVLQLVMHQAISVTEIFERFAEVEELSEAELPSYKWYYHGLYNARTAFVEKISKMDTSGEWSYHIRDVIKDLHFVNLWDGLWQEAMDICCSGYGIKQLHYMMHTRVVQQAKLPSSDPRPWMPDGGNLGSVAARLWDNFWPSIDGEPVRFHLPYHFHRLDLSSIEQHSELTHYTEDEPWGQRFYSLRWPGEFDDNASDAYDDEDDTADSYDDEEEDSFESDIGEDVETEAYGPLIDPDDLAEAVLVKPTGQRCTVCMEDHDYNYGDGRTMKLHTCGHYFHYECIRDWLNGASTNSNLCPECRIQFSDSRRLVRPVNSSQAEHELEANEDSDSDTSVTSSDQEWWASHRPADSV